MLLRTIQLHRTCSFLLSQLFKELQSHTCPALIDSAIMKFFLSLIYLVLHSSYVFAHYFREPQHYYHRDNLIAERDNDFEESLLARDPYAYDSDFDELFERGDFGPYEAIYDREVDDDAYALLSGRGNEQSKDEKKKKKEDKKPAPKPPSPPPQHSHFFQCTMCKYNCVAVQGVVPPNTDGLVLGPKGGQSRKFYQKLGFPFRSIYREEADQSCYAR